MLDFIKYRDMIIYLKFKKITISFNLYTYVYVLNLFNLLLIILL